MKKNILMVLVLVFILTICGCNNKISNQNKEIQQYKTAVQETKESKINLSELIPNPKESFFNTEFEMITGEKSYTVYLDYVTEDEWNEYLSKCKETGLWTKESYCTDYSWYVDSEDNLYRLFLDRYGDENKYMTIMVTKKESNELK